MIAGNTSSNNGDVTGNHGYEDVWIVKLNYAGILQWQKCLGGSLSDYAYSIHSATYAGYIVAGLTSSNNGDVSGNHGATDYWVVKLDSAGNIQWQKCFGGSNNEWAYSIKPTIDGGYVMAGWTVSNNGDVTGHHGNYDQWVIKIDSSGVLEWQKCLGGTGDDVAHMIEPTLDKGFIVLGFTNSTDGDVTGNHGGWDYWVVKLDSVGVIQWQKCLGGSNNEWGFSCQSTPHNKYILAGYTNSNDGDVNGNHGFWDYWVLKLDSIGTIEWQKCYGGATDDQAQSLKLTPDGGFAVSGTSWSNNGDVSGNHGGGDYWIVKLYPDTITSTSHLENSTSNISISPNPFTSNITIGLNNANKPVTVFVYDILGKEILKQQLATQNTKITTDNFAKGVYFLKAGSEIKKIVKM